MTTLTSPRTNDSLTFIEQLNKGSMKHVLALIFLPVALPYLVYKFVSAFRKRYGLKLRPLEGKVG